MLLLENIDGIPVQQGVSQETAEWLLARQRRCVETGRADRLEIHHRFPRGDFGYAKFKNFLDEYHKVYFDCYNSNLPYWGLHSVQNLVVLTSDIHKRITDGDRELFEKYLYSFTCPYTGFNIPFYRKCRMYLPEQGLSSLQ